MHNEDAVSPLRAMRTHCRSEAGGHGCKGKEGCNERSVQPSERAGMRGCRRTLLRERLRDVQLVEVRADDVVRRHDLRGGERGREREGEGERGRETR